MTTTGAEARHLGLPAKAALTLCGVSLALAGTRLGLAIIDPASSDAASAPGVRGGGVTMAAFEALILAAIAGLGGVVTFRRPQNPIGWILIAIPLFLSLWTVLSHGYWSLALGSSEPSGAATVVAWVGSWVWIPAMLAALTLFPLLFPTGSPPTPRWRWIQWVVVAAGAAMFLSIFAPGTLEGKQNLPLANPFGVDGGVGVVLQALGVLGFALMFLAMFASVASLVVRFRRSRGDEREQIKWVAAAAVFLGVVYATLALGIVHGDASFATFLFGLLIVAAAVAVAMLKFRLYDVDVVISRTLLVAGLVGFITASYVGIVVGIGSLLGGGGGEPNVVLSVVATTVVAVLFQPVRVWLQRVANRLVFGRRSTPYDVLSGFATRVGAGSRRRSLWCTGGAGRGRHGGGSGEVWLQVGSQLRAEAAWPVEAETVDAVDIDVEGDVDAAVGRLPGADLSVPVVERGELLGVLTIAKPRGERVSEVDVDLVERLAAASGVVLRNLRLDAELGQRLEDLEASRRRLVSAQDDARRRIEADLAGGSRAELGLLRVKLTALAGQVDAVAAPKTAMLLAQLVDATDGALVTLAGLAAGVYPPRLAADGLVAALTEQATKAALPVRVHAENVGRYAPEVEAAVYFAVLEGLQNVAKYANATRADVRLTHADNQLTFQVADDGDGFDQTTTTLGTGLQGITDRLDTVNGTLTITSTPGTGATITGHIPIPTTTAASEREPELVGATP